MKPFVTVVVPTYNRAVCIGRAVESVLSQNFTDYEVIVVDDGSTDSTRAVLEEYGKRIKYIFQENQGVSAARNRGIQSADADWVAFLDSDDQWHCDYLNLQVKSINDHPHVITHIANSETVYSDGRREDHFLGTGLRNKLLGAQPLLLERPLSTILRYAPWFLQASVMRRKELIRCGLFNPRLRIAEDFDIFSRMARKGQFCIYNRALVYVNRNDELFDHLSKQVYTQRLRTLEVYAEILTKLSDEENLDHNERLTLSYLLGSNRRAVANLLLKAGNRKGAKRLYSEAFKIYPGWRSAIKYLMACLPQIMRRHLIGHFMIR